MTTDEHGSPNRRRYRLIGTALLIWVAVVIAGAGAAADDSLLGVKHVEIVWMIGMVLMALVGLIILIVLNPFSGEWVEPERRPRSRRAWVILFALFAVLVWKPELIPELEFGLGEGESAEGGAGAAEAATSLGADEADPEPVAQLSDLLLMLLAVLVVALVVFLLRRRENPDDTNPLEGSGSELEADLAVALEELTAELEMGADPRTAVLAAYALLEAVLSDHGSTRASAETPTEHLRRSLSQLRVEPAPLMQLGRLYEIARFSDQSISERDQRDAADSLERTRAELASLT